VSTSRIVIGSDHAAVALKAEIVADLRASGHSVEDIGTFTADSVDYPDIAGRVATAVAAGDGKVGILLCGTGIGMAIAANKFHGIRAANCHDTTTARLSRQHNDANVLCLGGRILGTAVALDVVKCWLATAFEGGRHERRVLKMKEIEKKEHR